VSSHIIHDSSDDDQSDYDHPILYVDAKDIESLDEHLQDRFLRSPTGKHIIFILLDKTTSVGGTVRI
jgi:hypothetical protein